MGRIYQNVGGYLLGMFALALVGCQEPRLRTSADSGNSAEELAEETEKNPAPKPNPVAEEKMAEEEPKEAPAQSPSSPVAPKATPKANPQQLAKTRQMLEAQLTGIRSLESDLSRESQKLAVLQNQLRGIRARQAGSRGGGVLVERVDGKSTLVNREKEAREVQAQIQVQEQLVNQLAHSLQVAREQYQSMQTDLERLRQK